jgi:hypothetical protein
MERHSMEGAEHSRQDRLRRHVSDRRVVHLLFVFGSPRACLGPHTERFWGLIRRPAEAWASLAKFPGGCGHWL